MLLRSDWEGLERKDMLLRSDWEGLERTCCFAAVQRMEELFIRDTVIKQTNLFFSLRSSMFFVSASCFFIAAVAC
jgi:hypothetical protein